VASRGDFVGSQMCSSMQFPKFARVLWLMGCLHVMFVLFHPKMAVMEGGIWSYMISIQWKDWDTQHFWAGSHKLCLKASHSLATFECFHKPSTHGDL